MDPEKVNPPCDWQSSKHEISERGQYLLETGQWSDCKFVVGQEPHRDILKAHKLFLAMSSAVFEAMFFGGLPEKSDIIPIKDVQPEAFKAMLEYIYTDHVTLSSIELAYETCYCAKKYMIPPLIDHCKLHLLSHISAKEACKAYEYAKLLEEPDLMTRSLQIICEDTKEVLEEPSWEEVELGTLLKVLDQEKLNINSELDLFRAVECWAKAECGRKSLDSSDRKSLRSVIGNALSKIRFLCLSPQQFAEGSGMLALLTQDEAFAILMNIICTENKVPMPEGFSTESTSRDKPPKTPAPSRVQARDMFKKMFRQALESSLCLTQQHCKTREDILNASLINESNGESSGTSQSTSRIFENRLRPDSENLSGNNVPLTIVEGGIRKEPKYYCFRMVYSKIDFINTDTLDCSLAFSVDKNICILGVQVPTQIAKAVHNRNHALDHGRSYTEILYAHLLDSDDTRLTYTHFTTKVDIDSLLEIMFNRPVYIQRNKVYRVGVVFNTVGWYPVGFCDEKMTCKSVSFTFRVGNNEGSMRDGLIRSIIFTCH